MGSSPETDNKETIQPKTPEAALEELSPQQRGFLLRLNFFVREDGLLPIPKGMMQSFWPNPGEVADTLDEFTERGLVDQSEDGPYTVSQLGQDTIALIWPLKP